MSNERLKVSIIVPVYNVEKYLERCLNSLVNQSFKEIEIICINDGSTDSSLEILRNYESKDNRIKIIDKENTYILTICHNEIFKGKKLLNVDGYHIYGKVVLITENNEEIKREVIKY